PRSTPTFSITDLHPYRPISLPSSFTAPPPPEIYPLSLHDALPIWGGPSAFDLFNPPQWTMGTLPFEKMIAANTGASIGRDHFFRSEEHTSELQSRSDLVCRLLLEKKKIHSHGHVSDNVGLVSAGVW